MPIKRTLLKKKHKNTKKAYTDGLKRIGKKVDFAAVFTNIIRRGALLAEAFIHTAESWQQLKITLKEIQKMTDSQSSMQSIEYNKENYPY